MKIQPTVMAMAAVVAAALAGCGTLRATGPLPATKAHTATTWTPAQAPLPANADHTFAQLYAVACPSALACTAVGSYTGSAGWQALLLTKSGTSWTATQAPVPVGAATDPYATPTKVACASATACAAIGSYTDSSNVQQGLLLTRSGSSWTAAQAPLPAGTAANLSPTLVSVACNSASSCVVVGSYEDASFNFHGLLLTGSGSSWIATQPPLPSGADPTGYVQLDAVKCPTATQCTAVGSYTDTAGHAQGLILTGYGSSWTATQAPLPANANTDPRVAISALSCSSASACTAVGTYDGAQQGLLLTGSGTTWTATEAPLPAGTQAGADLSAPHGHLSRSLPMHRRWQPLYRRGRIPAERHRIIMDGYAGTAAHATTRSARVRASRP